MSYQVIARKYRPQTFTDLTGQEHITRTLSNALEQRRLHQAYIFSGARGTGKTTTARILAKGLNCQTGITSRPCLKCASCLEIAVGNSIDVIEIDAASNTQVDNVREVIINNIAMNPARDRYKIFVIDEVHMLSNHSFNALLKTIEEPPSHVTFIMATTELHKVPDTILSRCQQFEFRHIPAARMMLRLREIATAEQVRISDQGLREIARAGAGSLRDALSALDQVIAFSGNEIKADDVTASLGLVGEKTLLSFTEAIATQDSAGILRLVEELDSRGYDLRNFTRELMTCFRHLLVIRSGITSGEVLGVSEGEIESLTRLATQFSEEDLVRFFHLLASTEKEIKDSPHPRFQLETGLIRLTHTLRLRSLDELIAKLEALQTGIGEGTSNANPALSPAPPARSQSSPAPGTAARTGHKTEARPREAAPAKTPEPSASDEPDFPPMTLEEPPEFSESFSRNNSFNQSTQRSSSSSATAPAGRPAGRTDAVSSPPRATPVASGSEVQAILAELDQLKRHSLVTTLEDAQSVSYASGTLTVALPSDDFLAKRLRESSAIFRDLGQRLFGQPLNLEVIINGQNSSQSGARIDEAAEAKAKLHEEAMKNPAVRMLVEQFRGEIVEVRKINK